MFSYGIFKSNIKRFWIVPVVATIILFFTMTFQMILITNKAKEGKTDTLSLCMDLENPEDYIEIYLYNPIVLLTIFVLPVLVSILLFKYANEEKSSSFIHGLPISKRKLYITNILTGIIMYVIPFLVNLIIIIVLKLGDMGNYLQFADITKWFEVCMLYSTMFFAFATFIGAFCASKISHGILTYILMYAPIGIIELTSIIIEKMLYGFKGLSSNLEEFSKLPFIKIMNDFNEVSFYYSSETIKFETSTIIIYIVSIIVMLVLGYFVYKKRKLEITKEFIAFKGIRSFIKYAATFLVNLFSYMCFYEIIGNHNIKTLLVSFIITLIAYLIIEMILKKTYKVFKSIIGFIVYAIIVTITFVILNTGAFGYETRIPKVEDVQEVSFGIENETVNLKEKQNIENIIDLQQKLVAEKKEGYSEYTLEYKLKNGRKIVRTYDINNSIYKEELNKILTSNEYYEEEIKQIKDIQKIKSITINVSYKLTINRSIKTITINESDMLDFIENLIKDIKNGKAIINDVKQNFEISEIYVYVSLKEDVDKIIKYISFEDINIEKYIN